MGCNAKCGVMHNVSDISGAILNMVLQSGIVYCERCWCDMKWAIWWGMMVWRGMWPCDVEMVRWCNVKCGGMMWRGARCRNDNVLHWHSNLTTTAQYFTSNHISGTAHHSTSHHISRISIPSDHTAWCQIWCDVQRFAMPDAGCCTLFTLWLWCGPVRCNVEYVRHQWRCDAVMSCNVRCEMLWCDVEWCSAWGMWRCADARCEMWLWK